ncbi:hypothetical protein AF335_08950 [Streptomyces eurocidicus]|uniref:Uncharacterized protein n=2 Tax=Streptomyces eurocidicus TaxID=66423 RepID=A0A2N8P0V4_STREU|nr:hypothetical protein AF335_08950 [Streptomyces eurocidicus]
MRTATSDNGVPGAIALHGTVRLVLRGNARVRPLHHSLHRGVGSYGRHDLAAPWPPLPEHDVHVSITEVIPMLNSPLVRSPLWLAPPERLPADVHALRRAATTALGSPPTGDPIRLPDEHEATFDAFFGVARSAGDPVSLLVHALATTYATTPGTAHAPSLRLALQAAGITPASVTAATATASPEECWVLGHRLFFALIQGAVVGLRHAVACSTDVPESVLGIRTADVFLAASASALRLTASFSRQDYEDAIRPAMSRAGEDSATGFSGLWSADHRVLVGGLRAWGIEAAQHRAPRVLDAERSLRATLSDVYAAHSGICHRFTGDGPSLLNDKGSAVLKLERLACARQRLLPPDEA